MKYLPNQWKLTGLICVKPYFLRENSTTGIYPFSTGELLTCMVKPLCTPIIKVLCWRIRIPSSWIMISLIFLVGQRPPKKASQICCHHLSAACWNQWKLIGRLSMFHPFSQASSTFINQRGCWTQLSPGAVQLKRLLQICAERQVPPEERVLVHKRRRSEATRDDRGGWL